jgi:hypothetical protein
MTTVGVTAQPGVGIDWDKTDYAVVPPVWAEDLPLIGAHCFFNIQTRKWTRNEYPHDECNSWQYHPAGRGNPPFMRFIHALQEQLTDQPNPFSGDAKINLIDPSRSVTTDGRRASCEIYMVKNAADDWKIAFRIFLIRTRRVSPIECYDERYLEACIAARAAIDQQYEDEVQNA